MSKGLEKVRLSPQHLLSCDFRGQQSCKGGYLDRAWNFVRKYGWVLKTKILPIWDKCSVLLVLWTKTASHILEPRKNVAFPDMAICVPPVATFQQQWKEPTNTERRQLTVWATKLTLCTKFTNLDRFKVRRKLHPTELVLFLVLISATIKVYHDFFTYSSGIYKHTDLSLSQRTGYHSVRIVGWGEEVTYNGVEKYWVSKRQANIKCSYLKFVVFHKESS